MEKKMKTAFCLLNHKLTENQLSELTSKFNVSTIVYTSAELSASWAQIPATENLDMSIIGKVIEWLKDSAEGDVFIIQGEFGSTFLLVDYALRKHLIPLHAVTKRIETEEVEGEIVKRHYEFKHVCFRKYCYADSISNNLL